MLLRLSPKSQKIFFLFKRTFYWIFLIVFKKYYFFQNFNDLKTVLSNKVDKAFSLGLTVQPFVVYVGDDCSFSEKSSNTPFSFYTIVNETHFKVETILKAYDVCFKSFHTLNLKHPFEAEQVWRFMQVYFYKIPESRVEKNFFSIRSLIRFK